MSIASGYGPNWTTAESWGLDAQRRIAELEQQLTAAQAEARVLRERAEKAERNYQWMVERAADQHLSGYRELARRAADAENVADGLRAELARVREIVSGMREYADSCDHPSEASKRNAVEYWLTQLEDALSPAPEPAPAPELLVIGVDLAAPGADRTVKAVIKQPPEHESLPLMARRLRHKDDDLGELYESGKRLCTISGEPPLREPMPGFVLYRIADTDEHGLKVIPRTADMPEGAKYRLTWIMQADAAGGDVEYTDSLPLALEANRSGAVSERIEDYREIGQEGNE